MHGRVGAHRIPHDILTDGAGVDGDAVAGNHLLQLLGGLVALRTAGITHDHGVIVLLRALEGDLQALGGAIRHIVKAVVSGEVVLVGVHAEHREVAGVAGPHPVVGFATELAHRSRRSGNKADVGIGAINNQVVHIVVVEARDHGAAARILGDGSVNQLLPHFIRLFSRLDLGRDILHRHQESDTQTRDRNFLGAFVGPIAFHQVVVLIGGKALDTAISAVVVGYQQALVGDDLTGAASAELDDRVFQGRLVDGIDLLRRQLAAGGLQVFLVHLLDQRQQPHTFIGGSAHHQGKRSQESNDTFHVFKSRI